MRPDTTWARIRRNVTGQPHSLNLERWDPLADHRDMLSQRPVLTGLDRDSIERREVPPMGSLLPHSERAAVLRGAG